MLKYNDKLKKDNRVTILSLSWRDIKSPTAGGAEVHTHEMLHRMNHEKYRIIHLSAMYDGLEEQEEIDGVNYIRKGGVFSCINYARKYYKKNRDNIDFVIDQCNTHRYFTTFWVEKEKRIFYIHQLTREIWDINLKFPFNKIGKVLETPLLKLNKNDYVITVSESTKQDLVDVGFKAERIFIVPNGISFEPWTQEQFCEKEKNPTFIYVGRYASYKGIDAAVEAIGKLKKDYPQAKLWILGKRNDEYINEVLKPISDKYDLTWGDREKEGDIITWGYVSEEEKLKLISRATALVFPSIREGWGIPITEAGNVGTPSIVYDSPGIRDAVKYGKYGYLCKSNSSGGLYEQMIRVAQMDDEYEEMRRKTFEFSKCFVWNQTCKNVEKLIDYMKGNI